MYLPGNCKVEFDNNGLNYFGEWFNDKGGFDTANLVAVTGGGMTSDIDARLDTGGQIIGRVTDDQGAGIGFIRVFDWGNSSHSTSTDSNGDFRINRLRTGKYKIRFDTNYLNYLSEWYNDKSSSETADPVAVTAGSITSDIDAQLATGGQITGRVTDDSGAGINNIYVAIYGCGFAYSFHTFTDSSGNYGFRGLSNR